MVSASDNPRDHEHWRGWKNKAIRYYFYMSKGLDLFNNFRYVFMAIAGLYIALKLKNALWLLAMFGISIPILMVAGYVSIHHIGKVVDWLGVRFGTHYSLYNFKLLEDIRDAVQRMAKKRDQIVD